MRLERYISELYLEKGIVAINQLNIKTISEAFDLPIVYYENISQLTYSKLHKIYYIQLNAKKDEITQYEEFLHELAHFILKQSNLKNYFTYNMVELKINNLAQMLSCPIHIFNDNYNLIEFSEEYNMTHRLAEKRLNRLKVIKVGESSGDNNNTNWKEREEKLASKIST